MAGAEYGAPPYGDLPIETFLEVDAEGDCWSKLPIAAVYRLSPIINVTVTLLQPRRHNVRCSQPDREQLTV